MNEKEQTGNQSLAELIRSHAFLELGIERGQSMAHFGERICSLATSSVLDLGCQLGGISLAFSQVSREVTAVDMVYDWKR